MNAKDIVALVTAAGLIVGGALVPAIGAAGITAGIGLLVGKVLPQFAAQQSKPSTVVGPVPDKESE